MPFSTKDTGEQFIVQSLADKTAYVGLYDESTDQLPDGADVPVPTEPSDGNYQGLTYSASTTPLSINQNTEGDWEVVFAEQRFDLTNATGYVDGAFVVINYQAQDESSANDHLWFTTELTDVQGNATQVDLEGTNGLDFSATYTVIDPSQVV